jgi:hypothetical protein
VLQVEHRTTNRARDYRISGVKKDMTDAQALCYVAQQYMLGVPPRGVHMVDRQSSTHVRALRILIWAYMRADKERTRSRNRLRQVAHSIWPALGQHLTTYLRAVDHNIVTPADLRRVAHKYSDSQEVPAGFEHATRRRELLELAASLPIWLEAEPLREAIKLETLILKGHETNRATLKALIKSAVQREPFAEVTDLWLTVPCSGLIPIAAIHVATHGQADLLNRDQFRAALGSHPHLSESGETSESVNARQGFKPAKRMIYLWTMRLLADSQRPNRIATAYDQRKARTENHAIRVARQQLCDILSGIARTGTPYDPNLDTQEGDQ